MKMLDYYNFCVAVVERLPEFLPERSNDSIDIIPYLNRRGVEDLGIVITGNQKTAPIMAAEDYYLDYLAGKSLFRVLGELAEDFRNREQHRPARERKSGYELLKERIFIKACKADRNEEMLAQAPHERHEDLAFTYWIYLSNSEAGLVSFPIRNQEMARWGVDAATLKAGAWASMKKLFPVQILSIAEFVAGLSDHGIMSAVEPKEFSDSLRPMCIIRSEFFGAAYMFDDETLSQAAEKLAGNLIVIPSSVHEAIVLREEDATDLSYWKDIHMKLSGEMVAEEEVLTDAIYRYDAANRTLLLVDDVSGPVMEMQM